MTAKTSERHSLEITTWDLREIRDWLACKEEMAIALDTCFHPLTQPANLDCLVRAGRMTFVMSAHWEGSWQRRSLVGFLHVGKSFKNGGSREKNDLILLNLNFIRRSFHLKLFMPNAYCSETNGVQALKCSGT